MKKKHVLIIAALISPFCLLAEPKPPVVLVQPNNLQAFIAFLPAIFFLLVLIAIAFKLRKGAGETSGLLAEKDKQAAPVKSADGENPTPPQSVSRLIAFLTGLVALIIGISLTTFSLFCYFANPGTLPDLSTLSTVIYGLGIGVLPYGFNKASTALKS